MWHGDICELCIRCFMAPQPWHEITLVIKPNVVPPQALSLSRP